MTAYISGSLFVDTHDTYCAVRGEPQHVAGGCVATNVSWQYGTDSFRVSSIPGGTLN